MTTKPQTAREILCKNCANNRDVDCEDDINCPRREKILSELRELILGEKKNASPWSEHRSYNEAINNVMELFK